MSWNEWPKALVWPVRAPQQIDAGDQDLHDALNGLRSHRKALLGRKLHRDREHDRDRRAVYNRWLETPLPHGFDGRLVE